VCLNQCSGKSFYLWCWVGSRDIRKHPELIRYMGLMLGVASYWTNQHYHCHLLNHRHYYTFFKSNLTLLINYWKLYKHVYFFENYEEVLLVLLVWTYPANNYAASAAKISTWVSVLYESTQIYMNLYESGISNYPILMSIVQFIFGVQRFNEYRRNIFGSVGSWICTACLVSSFLRFQVHPNMLPLSFYWSHES